MLSPFVALLGLAPSGPLHHAVAFEGATLAAVGAARRITEPHEAQFRTDRAVVLRGCHSTDLEPLKKLGDPQPWEMDGVDAEMRIAAALVSRLLDAPFLRDPCGSWCGGWDNAYDHYSYWRILDQFPAETRAMVVLPREPMTVTLCGYPEAVVRRTAHSSTAYPKSFRASSGASMAIASEAAAYLDAGTVEDGFDYCSTVGRHLAEPELELEAGDAIILDGSHCEGLGGMGGGHLVYRFEACAATADGVLWSDPLHAAAEPAHSHELLLDFAEAKHRLRETS